MLALQRRTGDGKYTDRLTFSLNASAGGGCMLAGCSESQVTSVVDSEPSVLGMPWSFKLVAMLRRGEPTGTEREVGNSMPFGLPGLPGTHRSVLMCSGSGSGSGSRVGWLLPSEPAKLAGR